MSYELTRINAKYTKRKLIFVLFFTIVCGTIHAQPFTRADSLRGYLFPERRCYDVKFYDLDLSVDPKTQTIAGSNRIVFSVVHDFDSMQVDLTDKLKVEKITDLRGKKLPYSRELNAVFVRFPQKMRKGTVSSIRVYYSGAPKVSTNPPWDDGFVWKKDTTGNYWTGVACQGDGASVWWPNKDHQSDEPDSMRISVAVPPGYTDVSNGRLRSIEKLDDGWSKYTWFVSYPINNYCATVNIGKYVHIHDGYVRGPGDTLDLDYYVLPVNEEIAKEHFKQVKPMMQCYEKLFGRYPFERDGYKLIQTPYLGMEHQSAVSYGNRYLNGYLGRSRSDPGMKFDYIIIHETAHEWWGNSITTNDIADLWVHEGFATYTEGLYLECIYNYQTSAEYLNAGKKNIGNKNPIVGPYGVNKSGSDVYLKAALALNTLRSVIDNDKLWFEILYGIQQTFKYKTVDGTDIIKFIENKSGMGSELDYFFDQYFYYANLPELDIELKPVSDSYEMRYKWTADVRDFRMSVSVTTSPGEFTRIFPTTQWQAMTVHVSPEEFKVDEDRYFVNVKMNSEDLGSEPRINTN
jgi:aminopeptidase N